MNNNSETQNGNPPRVLNAYSEMLRTVDRWTHETQKNMGLIMRSFNDKSKARNYLSIIPEFHDHFICLFNAIVNGKSNVEKRLLDVADDVRLWQAVIMNKIVYLHSQYVYDILTQEIDHPSFNQAVKVATAKAMVKHYQKQIRHPSEDYDRNTQVKLYRLCQAILAGKTDELAQLEEEAEIELTASREKWKLSFEEKNKMHHKEEDDLHRFLSNVLGE